MKRANEKQGCTVNTSHSRKPSGRKKRNLTSEGRLTAARLFVQFLALVFANSVLFGIPYFLDIGMLKHFYIPNAMSKFFLYTPTYSLLYRLQDTLAGGSPTLIFDIAMPIAIFVLLVIVLGRVWCGWLCPLGFVQELAIRLRRALNVNKYDMTQKTADICHRFKYIALFLILFYSLALSTPLLGLWYFRNSPLPLINAALPLPYEQLDPNRALFVYPQMGLGLLPMSTAVPLLSLGAFAFFFVTAFMIKRFWCYICPAGAMNAPLNKYAMVRLSKNAENCTHCRICLRVCPMKIKKVYESQKTGDVTSWKCIHCYRCVEACPEDCALTVNFFGKRILKSRSFGGD